MAGAPAATPVETPPPAAAPAGSSQVLAAEYGCPELPLLVDATGAGEPGYFAFGPGLVLHGRLAGGPVRARPDGPLHDAGRDVRLDGPAPRLPFDPGEVIEGFRRERYAAAFRPHARRTGAAGLARQLYYLVRAHLPRPVRQGLQRAYLRQGSRHAFPRWPVDTTVEDLLDRLFALALARRGLDRVPVVGFWPDGARACVMMTHDVDTPAGLDRCRALMDLDERFGIRASFQLVPEGRYAIPEALVREMRARGFEVNVHDLDHDGRLFDDRDEFLRRAARINAHARALGARGFRSGVLYRNPDWLGALDVAFDMSIPSTGHLDPQPGGCCTVRPYLLGDLVELPLTTTQDYTLFHLLGDFSLTLWQRQVDTIAARHGLASFNVHPDYLDDRRARAAYVDLLRWLRERADRDGLWVALPGEVERWWRARSGMRVVRRGEGFAVEGPGAERARVAWAGVEGGRVVHRLALRA